MHVDICVANSSSHIAPPWPRARISPRVSLERQQGVWHFALYITCLTYCFPHVELLGEEECQVAAPRVSPKTKPWKFLFQINTHTKDKVHFFHTPKLLTVTPTPKPTLSLSSPRVPLSSTRFASHYDCIWLSKTPLQNSTFTPNWTVKKGKVHLVKRLFCFACHY